MNQNFGKALEWLHAGMLIRRTGWNGKMGSSSLIPSPA